MLPSLLDVTESQVTQFERELDRSIRQFERRITGLLAKLEIENGVILKTPANLQYAASLLPELNQMLEDSGYPDAVAKFQQGDSTLLAQVRKSAAIPLAFTRADAATLSALRAMQNSEFTGIGANAMESVRQVVMNTIMTGSRLEGSLGMIKKNLSTNLQKYAWTYANTTRRDVIQLANDLAAANTEGENYWAYNGPLDDVTRDACIELLSIGYFSDAEREAAEAEYAAERMYNCRHSFDLVSKETYDEHRG